MAWIDYFFYFIHLTSCFKCQHRLTGSKEGLYVQYVSFNSETTVANDPSVTFSFQVYNCHCSDLVTQLSAIDTDIATLQHVVCTSY